MVNCDHTFVICAYKESPYLQQCIESLKNQSIQSQIILYTSTPNDYIVNLCTEYDIPFFTNSGGSIGKDWNNALSFVKTKYATIAHQDDFYLKNYSKKIMATFKKYPETLISYSNYSEWKDGNAVSNNRNLRIKKSMLKMISVFPKSIFWRTRILAFGNAICCPAVSYNLEKLKNFQFDEKMRVSLDWKAWYVIGHMGGDFRFINESLMYHRIHQDSETTNSIHDNSRTKEDLDMFKLYWPDFFAETLLKFYVRSQETND